MKKILIYISVSLGIMTSCTKIDDYKKYQGGREIEYPGVMDSVKVFSGNKRVLLYGLFTSDPKITKYRITWNGEQRSIEKDITRTAGVDTVRLYLDNMDEGGVTFQVRTFYANGTPSVPVDVTGVVYGDNYANGIINRGFTTSGTKYDANTKTLTIDWISIDPSAIFTTVEYTDVNDLKKIVKVLDPEANKFFINDYKTGTDVSINTAYRPNSTAIDTFYVAKKNIFKR